MVIDFTRDKNPKLMSIINYSIYVISIEKIKKQISNF